MPPSITNTWEFDSVVKSQGGRPATTRIAVQSYLGGGRQLIVRSKKRPTRRQINDQIALEMVSWGLASIPAAGIETITRAYSFMPTQTGPGVWTVQWKDGREIE